MENYQTPDGVRVPEALQPFMMGVKFMPFVNELNKKGKLQPRKQQIYDPLFNRDMYRVTFSPDVPVGFRDAVEYLFRNMKLKKTLVPLSGDAEADVVICYHDEVVSEGISAIKFISEKEKSALCPKTEEETMAANKCFEWYAALCGGKPISAEQVKDQVLPQIEAWLGEGTKFLAGPYMTTADLVFCAEIMQAKKGDKNVCKEFKLTSKWLNKVGEPKMWK